MLALDYPYKQYLFPIKKSTIVVDVFEIIWIYKENGLFHNFFHLASLNY